jgi:septal ring factor EnvC (AmiA/AmiB activator)
MAPGPNDYHIVIDKDEDGKELVRAEPGLGKDEPKERPKRADPAIMAALHQQGEEIDRKRADLEAEKQTIAEQKAELVRMRAELAADLAKLQAEPDAS